MICPTCNHENTRKRDVDQTTDARGLHRLGKCERCNCGESEVRHINYSSPYYAPPDYLNNVHLWGERLSYRLRPGTRFRY